MTGAGVGLLVARAWMMLGGPRAGLPALPTGPGAARLEHRGCESRELSVMSIS